jgi:uncharacterized phiE125 gp8 family phage protein
VALKLITPPASEPVTRVEAKDHLRLETTADDTTVDNLIVAARQFVEEFLWRVLITQTWELTLDDFPTDHVRWSTTEIRLPCGDVQSVVSVKYDDESGNEQTFSALNYIVDGYPPARLVLKRAATWPNTSGEILAVRVRFIAGYGLAAAVPQPIKQAMLLLISQMYELRTPEVTAAVISSVKFSFEALLSPYRLASFA